MKLISKRILSLLLSLSFCPFISVPEINAAENIEFFEDISGHWAEADINFMHSTGLVNGVSEKEFLPDTPISRAEIVTMIVRGLNLKEDIYSINFSDISARDDWFAGYLGAAVNAGIIENDVFAFNPTVKIQRSEVAKMLRNAIKYAGLSKEAEVKYITYNDVSSEDKSLSEAISAVSVLGVMEGISEDEFSPSGFLTRAEAVAVVKRLSLVAGTISEINIDLSKSDEMTMANVENGIAVLNGDYSYIAVDDVYFHYGINQLEVSASASAEGLQLELWIDSLNPMTGVKLGTVTLETTGAVHKLQNTRIFKSFGKHKVYLRLLGVGVVNIKDVCLKNDGFDINPKNAQSFSNGAKKTSNGITNLVLGSMLEYGEIEFGKGYDTIELTMENSVDGQLFEILLDDEKAGVVETSVPEGNKAVISASVVKAEKTKKLSLKTITDVDGVITNIRFYNALNKADIYLDTETAKTNLNIKDSSDYFGGKETDIINNEDVIKFSDVNFYDGFNVLSARVKKSSESEKGSYIEVRLDSEDGPIVGRLEDSIIESTSEYDIQSCTIYNTFGMRDLYLKAVGDIGWNIEYIKLQERGWYKTPIVQLEAERMDMYKATANNPNDEDTYKEGQIYAEASGRSAVLIEGNGGYVEFTVPEWFEENDGKTAITVRHSITDWKNEKNYSLGQDGAMSIFVNGNPVGLKDSFKDFEKHDTLTISSKLSQSGAMHFFNDSTLIIDSKIKPGDVIRLVPQIDENVTYCYIDNVDLEVIPKKKEKPQGYLSITDCGAVANDDSDDGVALRLACDMVRNSPDLYAGVWIPDGQFDIKSYIGERTKAADFTDVRILGSGLWYSKIQNHENGCTLWSTDYSLSNAIIRDFALWGYTWVRGWQTSQGDPIGAICFDGSKNNFVSDMWFEHWNAVFWLVNASGVYDKMRMKDNFADGININQKGYGIIYSNSFARGNGDDSFAIFSESKTSTNTASNILIKNNTIETNCWGGAIKVWGGKDISITHNLCKGANSAIGFNSDATVNIVPAPSNIWISYNRLENVGNWMFGHYSGAFIWEQYADSDLPAFKYVDNTIGRDIYIENNDTIDNPHNFFYNYCGGESPDAIYPIFRYNYIRNVGLNQKDTARIVQYDTSKLQGEIEFSHNIFEGNGVKFAQSKAKDDMLEQVFHENVGEIWED